MTLNGFFLMFDLQFVSPNQYCCYSSILSQENINGILVMHCSSVVHYGIGPISPLKE